MRRLTLQLEFMILCRRHMCMLTIDTRMARVIARVRDAEAGPSRIDATRPGPRMRDTEAGPTRVDATRPGPRVRDAETGPSGISFVRLFARILIACFLQAARPFAGASVGPAAQGCH